MKVELIFQMVKFKLRNYPTYKPTSQGIKLDYLTHQCYNLFSYKVLSKRDHSNGTEYMNKTMVRKKDGQCSTRLVTTFIYSRHSKNRQHFLAPTFQPHWPLATVNSLDVIAFQGSICFNKFINHSVYNKLFSFYCSKIYQKRRRKV